MQILPPTQQFKLHNQRRMHINADNIVQYTRCWKTAKQRSALEKAMKILSHAKGVELTPYTYFAPFNYTADLIHSIWYCRATRCWYAKVIRTVVPLDFDPFRLAHDGRSQLTFELAIL